LRGEYGVARRSRGPSLVLVVVVLVVVVLVLVVLEDERCNKQ
jgi:hypothetical protein